MALVPFPPDFVVLTVESLLGRILIWVAAIVVPLIAAFLIVAQERLWTGLTLAGAVTVVLGIFGIWIWIHAIFNAIPM